MRKELLSRLPHVFFRIVSLPEKPVAFLRFSLGENYATRSFRAAKVAMLSLSADVLFDLAFFVNSIPNVSPPNFTVV